MIVTAMGDEEIRAVTRFVDIEAPPPEDEAIAHLIFGTNQMTPCEIVADRYQRGLAPLIIVTGGVNRHNGIVEGQAFRQFLLDRGVPDAAIRVEDQSANTSQNVEYALPFLREALSAGLRIAAISKWYHRRAVHLLKTYIRDVGPFYAISWEPVYAGKLVTRDGWPQIPDGARRVIREWEEVNRRVAEGSLAEVALVHGMWQ
jgi:hypothetical protein